MIDTVAIAIGPVKVHWYGIILGAAALAGLMLAIREGKRFNIPSAFFMDLLLVGVPAAIIGARLYYVAFKWDYYQYNLSELFAVWKGGIAIHGALIGAVIAAVIYVRYKGYNFWRIADICAPSLLAGQLIGRWGNFINQEAYGGPVTETFLRDTLNLPAWIANQMYINGAYHHPTFLYESLWNLLGLVLIFVIRRKLAVRAGELFIGYFIWYSIGRFFIEGLRTDSLAFNGPGWLESFLAVLWLPMTAMGFDPGAMTYGNIRIAQLIGLFIIAAGIALFVYRRVQGLAAERYQDPIRQQGVVSR